MNNKKFHVGQTVWIKPCEYDRNQNILETTITKVGRKYIYIKRHNRKFQVDTLQEVVRYGTGGKIYESMDAIRYEERIKELHREIDRMIPKLEEAQILAIAELLGLEVSPETPEEND